MILYHGSNINIENISLAMCRPYKDFGRGFYLTKIKEQAVQMAIRVKNIYGKNAVVNIYEFDESVLENNVLNFKSFPNDDLEEWAMFVMNNRNRKFKDYGSMLCNIDSKYDIVEGPVADDDMAMLFRQYEMEFITFEMLVEGMKYKKMSHQYSFHTERAIQHLKKVGEIYV